MNAHHDESRTLNSAALRTLHELQRTLLRQIDDLMAIGCEDLEATDAVVFAIESAQRALANAIDVRRNVLRGE